MDFNINDLRPGDVLLHASKGEVSKLIQWASNSDYSHIAVVYEPGLLAEAVSGGVQFAGDLIERIRGIPTAFHRIDARRPTGAGDPISDSALEALQQSAQSMKGRPFALNQLFELGLICAVRNRVPETVFGKWLVTRIIDSIVQVDPSRLLCSEFIYLSFSHAKTTPDGLLVPNIPRLKRNDRPFPKIDVLKLIKEYLDAAGKSTDDAQVMDLINEYSNLTPEQVDAQWTRARATLLSSLTLTRSPLSVLPAGGARAGPHPDLIEPQDFAESGSYKTLGSVVF